MTGILLVDKPPGPTSHDAVARARRTLGLRQVGHFGTLDPFASGLLVLGLGGATRLAPYVTAHSKSYRALVRLGARSTTDDADGVIEEMPVAAPPERDAVEAACARWTGRVAQVPPAYSAKRIAGQRAYARARAGEAVTLAPVDVTIERIVVVRYAWPDLDLSVECGPGTYIRALARDLGEELGTGGYCAQLRRMRVGPLAVETALSWEELADPERARGAVRPAEDAVAELPAARLDPTTARAAGQGRSVPAPGAPADARWVRLVGPMGLIGIGEPRRGAEGATWVQPRTVLYPAGERAR
jgi:tRNA pseudouridine55 synthase